MHEPQLLVMIVPAALKDDVVDTLITLEGVSGFNLAAIAGYSNDHSRFNLREQVEGYRALFRFEVIHTRGQQEQLCSDLRPVCSTAKIHYWIVPLKDEGHFGNTV